MQILTLVLDHWCRPARSRSPDGVPQTVSPRGGGGPQTCVVRRLVLVLVPINRRQPPVIAVDGNPRQRKEHQPEQDGDLQAQKAGGDGGQKGSAGDEGPNGEGMDLVLP